MEYPYNAIIKRDTLNTFKVVVHPAYLCMKMPKSLRGDFSTRTHGSQEDTRRAEGSWVASKAVHQKLHGESRLEGVNRRNLKIINFEHTLHPDILLFIVW
jgi:hypothetical protein